LLGFFFTDICQERVLGYPFNGGPKMIDGGVCFAQLQLASA
jgi:hypothetical protein